MDKIVIIGSPGAGKSKLAKTLSRILHIRVFHLDRLFRLQNWSKRPLEARKDIMQMLVREQQWIIDGNYFNTSELHLKTADSIIFLGISPLICLGRIIKRHRVSDGFVRRDIPKGSKDKLSLLLILKVLYYPIGDRRIFEQKLSNYISNGEHKQLIWLRSKNEVKDFLTQLEA